MSKKASEYCKHDMPFTGTAEWLWGYEGARLHCSRVQLCKTCKAPKQDWIRRVELRTTDGTDSMLKLPVP